MGEQAVQPTQRTNMPIVYRVFRGFAETGVGIYCNIMQFNTTRDSVFGLLQGGTQIPDKMTSQQLLAFLSGNATKLNLIAFTVAFVTQVVFWWLALPDVKYGHNTKLRRAIAIILFVLEVASDLQYAASTQMVLNGNLINVTTGGGAWLAILLYAICVGFGSTFVLVNGVRIIGNIFAGQAD